MIDIFVVPVATVADAVPLTEYQQQMVNTAQTGVGVVVLLGVLLLVLVGSLWVRHI